VIRRTAREVARPYLVGTLFRTRVFDRNAEKGYYPTPRAFQVGLESAFELGQAIARAARTPTPAGARSLWAIYTRV
jgi:hypothetical protein